MLFTFLVFGIFLSLFDVFIIQHLHDNVKRFLNNVKRLIDRFQIYYRRMVQLRLHFRSVRKLESRRDEPAPEHLRDRCEFRIAKSASF